MSKAASDAPRRLNLSSNTILLLVVLAILAVVFVFTQMYQPSPGKEAVETGRAMAQAGRLPEAERAWKEALRLDPNNAAALELLSELYRNTHRYQEAIAPLQKLAKLKPETPNLYANLAECLAQTGHQDAAFDEAEAQLKQDPNNIGALAIAAKMLPSRNEPKKELEYKRRLVQLKPDNPEFLLMLARTLVDYHYFDEAQPVADKLIQTAPDTPAGYGIRGEIEFRKNPTPEGLAKAKSYFEESLKRSPQESFPPHLYLGKIYTRLGQPDKAVAYLLKAKQLQPFRGDVDFALAEAYDRAGQSAKAEAARNEFVMLRQEYDTEKALEKRCVAAPNNFDYHLQLGKIKLRRKEFADADYYLHEALRIRPNDPQAQAALKQLAAQAPSSQTAENQEPGPRESLPPGGP
ncbi:MAG TPA: tetratricopeptide repeat protein [Chthonomonadaceae bacterium]|nr:tetratricopeptide repeat protein [Chthonomonadaceae bacterium]